MAKLSAMVVNADVAQRTEQGYSKAKVAGSSPAVSAKGLGTKTIGKALKENVDDSGALIGDKKYLVHCGEGMPVTNIAASQLTLEEISSLRKSLFVMQSQTVSNSVPLREIIQKHKDRLAYNAAYQRDLRTIKRLNLNCTVSVYRAGKYGEK